MCRIDCWHTVLPCMGTRKLAVMPCAEGYAVGRKLVRAYMREMGIHAVYPKQNLSKRNFKEAIVPYLLTIATLSRLPASRRLARCMSVKGGSGLGKIKITKS